MPTSDRLLPIGALLLNATIWGLSWWPTRALGAAGLHALWTTTIVFALSLLVVLSYAARVDRRTAPARASERRTTPIGALVVLAVAAGTTNAGFNWGVLVGEVVRVVLLFYLMPVWAALFAHYLLGEAITRASVARIGLSLAGAALVLWRPGSGLPLPAALGDWLGLAGGVGFALTNVMLRRLAGLRTSQRLGAMCVGSVVIPGTTAVLATAIGAIAAPPAPASGWMLGVVALAGALLFANLALQYGAARLPSSVTAVVMLFEIVAAAASAVLIAGEPLATRTIAGAALIMIAALLASTAASAPPANAGAAD